MSGAAKKQAAGMGAMIPDFMKDTNNPVGYMTKGLYDFFVDSRRLIQRCTKPDAKEFKKIASACSLGFGLMGFIGYLVKIVFIPINNIIVVAAKASLDAKRFPADSLHAASTADND